MKTYLMIPVAAATTAFMLAACSRNTDSAHEPAASPEVVITEELTSRLAAADRHDGTEDHVVEDCITCKLHMKGKTDHTAEIAGYEVHLCSGHCMETFTRNPAEALAGVAELLDIP